MADRHRRQARAIQTLTEFRAELLCEVLPQLEALRTRAGYHLAPGYRYEKGHARTVDKLLNDLIETLEWGRIEYEAPPPPSPPPTPAKVLAFARSMVKHGNAADRKKAEVFVQSMAEAAKDDELFQWHLAGMTPWADIMPRRPKPDIPKQKVDVASEPGRRARKRVSDA